MMDAGPRGEPVTGCQPAPVVMGFKGAQNIQANVAYTPL